ncbi:LysM peptidoglycan-binding domain-containing protein [Virgibacillus sp. NKC19-3]|uniref:LysM peptidoglycan-binding domain-containing protein n=1 Tax=Virgibacillus saliphilus TaxID=2831674 RepID=UPI001C9BA492|nr:LysM peptidoglycan-binding domain-containing protein [Virgibacillus sp. NKC19-3]MBY7143434.1 LysM peptidoglycan-binding domain-containing protein [Virgibacillus sp. NKC19-3]
MKKLVAILAGLIIAGISAMSVSAADYKVEKGDTLWDIANENNTNVETLMDINGLSSSVIYPKQELKLKEKQREYYVVQKGDTLFEISREHKIPIDDLKTWNNLSSDLIITGQKLAVNEVSAREQAPSDASEQTADSEAGTTEKNTQQAEGTLESEEAENNTEQAEENPESEEAENNTEQAEENSESGEGEDNTDQVEANSEPEEETEQQPSGQTMSVEATAYTSSCNGCSGVTATGRDLNEDPHAKVIAVDPNVIPLGTEVYVEGYGHAVASDTGGSIKGHKIDVHVPTTNEATSWGRKTVNITILE